ncbi:kelch-like protein diablo [Paramacrobiotus metropolitanus]|uniref:kelch-like protein diablo n=1 Tax=Paramacrobiotus metropolitanus TaxID=2943436 RepID=UPI0024464EE3|nr:kelch-like protein diablo [Paramacrobiotus metropolitanus]
MAECLRCITSSQRHEPSESPSPLKLDGSAFLRGLHVARNDLCDVSLRGADDPFKPVQPIPCHRILLMAHSGWFRRMLLSPMKESRQDTIQLHSVPHDILQQLVGYMYSFKINVDAGNALFLLQAADMLEMEEIVKVCKGFLRANIDSTNCLTIYHGVTQLINSDELNVEKEEQVVAAVVRWLDHSPAPRLQYLAEMARHLRVDFLTNDYLASLPGTPVGQLLHETIMPSSVRDSAPRNSYGPVIGTFWVDRWPQNPTAGIACRDPLTSTSWSFSCSLPPIQSMSDATFVMKNDCLLVYVVGKTGGGESAVCHHLQVYEVNLDEWMILATLPDHEYCKPVVICDQVYRVCAG